MIGDGINSEKVKIIDTINKPKIFISKKSNPIIEDIKKKAKLPSKLLLNILFFPHLLPIIAANPSEIHKINIENTAIFFSKIKIKKKHEIREIVAPVNVFFSDFLIIKPNIFKKILLMKTLFILNISINMKNIEIQKRINKLISLLKK